MRTGRRIKLRAFKMFFVPAFAKTIVIAAVVAPVSEIVIAVASFTPVVAAVRIVAVI